MKDQTRNTHLPHRGTNPSAIRYPLRRKSPQVPHVYHFLRYLHFINKNKIIQIKSIYTYKHMNIFQIAMEKKRETANLGEELGLARDVLGGGAGVFGGAIVSAIVAIGGVVLDFWWLRRLSPGGRGRGDRVHNGEGGNGGGGGSGGVALEAIVVFGGRRGRPERAVEPLRHALLYHSLRIW